MGRRKSDLGNTPSPHYPGNNSTVSWTERRFSQPACRSSRHTAPLFTSPFHVTMFLPEQSSLFKFCFSESHSAHYTDTKLQVEVRKSAFLGLPNRSPSPASENNGYSLSRGAKRPTYSDSSNRTLISDLHTLVPGHLPRPRGFT